MDPLSYDRPVYIKSKNFLTVPEEDFKTNIENLFEPTVFETFIDGIEYDIYSQPVPSWSTKMEDVHYYLFFLIEKEKSYASAQIA